MLRQLKCFYSSPHSYLKLQPIKSESVHLDPDVIVYHDIISDAEIAVVKSLAAPRLQRATVQNSLTGELETAHYRISKRYGVRVNMQLCSLLRRNLREREPYDIFIYSTGQISLILPLDKTQSFTDNESTPNHTKVVLRKVYQHVGGLVLRQHSRRSSRFLQQAWIE